MPASKSGYAWHGRRALPTISTGGFSVVSTIDQIIVILGPPQSAEDKTRLEERAKQEDLSVSDMSVARVPELIESLRQSGEDGSASLDRYFSQIVGTELTVLNPVATYYEKKGHRHPAITFATTEIVDRPSGRPLEQVSEAFRSEQAKSELARNIGMHLGLEAVEVFVTFG